MTGLEALMASDPFEAAAARTRRSVMQRQEPGIATQVVEAVPPHLGSMVLNGLMAPGRVYNSQEPLSTEQLMTPANQLAALMMSGTLAGAPAGAVASGPVRPSWMRVIEGGAAEAPKPAAKPMSGDDLIYRDQMDALRGIMGGAEDAAKGSYSALPMDQASRMARADAMMAPETFYRGEASGTLPREYLTGGHFSRDKSYADGFARKGGQGEARSFRLNLDNAFKDYEDLTAAQYGKLVAAADPTLAKGLVDLIAPGKDVAWFAEFAKRNPEFKVTNGTAAHIRHIIETNASNPVAVFQRAGFDALDSGRDVRKLTGDGIRSTDAAFDPAKAHWRDIMAALVPGAALAGGSLSQLGSTSGGKSAP